MSLRVALSAGAALVLVVLLAIPFLDYVPEGWPVVGALGGLVVLWYVLTELILAVVEWWRAS
jgi:hypothetical protein